MVAARKRFPTLHKWLCVRHLSSFCSATLPSSSAGCVRSEGHSRDGELGKVGNEIWKNRHLLIFFFLFIRIIAFLFKVHIRDCFFFFYYCVFRLWDEFPDLLRFFFFSKEPVFLPFIKAIDDQIEDN